MRPTQSAHPKRDRLALLVLLAALGCAAGVVVWMARTQNQAPAGASAAHAPAPTQTASPLGSLQPTPGLLPSGTVSVTLQLTTAAPARCRWSEAAQTPYKLMRAEFEQGPGARSHRAVVGDLHDLDDRWFYVRCADLSGGRDPDSDESKTHLRVLGPSADGYPRIANLWLLDSDKLSPEFLAGYDLLMPYRWTGRADRFAAIRKINPSIKILDTQYATKGRSGFDTLATEWWNSQPNQPGFRCLLRDSAGEILLYLGHPMYNVIDQYCRGVITQRNIDLFLSSLPDEGDNLAYDGIYWDLLHDHISWLGTDIDSNLDGVPDDPGVLDAAYKAAMEDLLAEVRAALPNAVLVGNEAPLAYSRWINGRLWEWQLRDILDGGTGLTWDAAISNFRDWAGRGSVPRITFVQSSPEPFYAQKYPSRFEEKIPPAMVAEAAASYQRMRYGLVSALMSAPLSGSVLFSYDFGPEWHGLPWWYDEFGRRGDGERSLPEQGSLPEHGYLGQPIAAPVLLVDQLSTPNEVVNGGFEGGLDGWNSWIDRQAGAAATVELDRSGGISGSNAAHIQVTSAAKPSSVLLHQRDISSRAGQSYTLSFWARSDVTRTLSAEVTASEPPGTDHGFNVQATVTPEWQHFHLSGKTTVTTPAGQLVFEVGGATGELWLDDVEFQTGALGVWARAFESGLAVINTTGDAQTARLPRPYCKLRGNQAPLFQTRVEDNDAAASGAWRQQAANERQFGLTVHSASGGSAATRTYVPTLAYGGTYEVFAWVAPSRDQSKAVSVTITHAQGETAVLLDETAGEAGWRSLGKYTFKAGSTGTASLAATGEGTVIADAFKWVSSARYNDGSSVSQVVLQPQDAIVLRNSCDMSGAQDHLSSIPRF